jgi:hypothetical protein
LNADRDEVINEELSRFKEKEMEVVNLISGVLGEDAGEPVM